MRQLYRGGQLVEETGDPVKTTYQDWKMILATQTYQTIDIQSNSPKITHASGQSSTCCYYTVVIV